ncbi:MAG TPA: hypothetical protein VJ742_13440 [Nitrososphaera sp.]|nr:hypothetical protein [Nitrososphaera sp.]
MSPRKHILITTDEQEKMWTRYLRGQCEHWPLNEGIGTAWCACQAVDAMIALAGSFHIYSRDKKSLRELIEAGLQEYMHEKGDGS